MVELLLSMHKALGLIPSITNKQTNKPHIMEWSEGVLEVGVCPAHCLGDQCWFLSGRGWLRLDLSFCYWTFQGASMLGPKETVTDSTPRVCVCSPRRPQRLHTRACYKGGVLGSVWCEADLHPTFIFPF